MPKAPASEEVLIQELQEVRARLGSETQRSQEVQQAIQEETFRMNQDKKSTGLMEQHAAYSEARIQQYSSESQAYNAGVAAGTNRKMASDAKAARAEAEENEMAERGEEWAAWQRFYRIELTETQLERDAAEREYLRRKEIHEEWRKESQEADRNCELAQEFVTQFKADAQRCLATSEGIERETRSETEEMVRWRQTARHEEFKRESIVSNLEKSEEVMEKRRRNLESNSESRNKIRVKKVELQRRIDDLVSRIDKIHMANAAMPGIAEGSAIEEQRESPGSASSASVTARIEDVPKAPPIPQKRSSPAHQESPGSSLAEMVQRVESWATSKIAPAESDIPQVKDPWAEMKPGSGGASQGPKFIEEYVITDEEARSNPKEWASVYSSKEDADRGVPIDADIQHKRHTTSPNFGEPDNPESWTYPGLTGNPREFFRERGERDALCQDPGNAKRGGMREEYELQTRIICAKGIDGRLHPHEVLAFFNLGGNPTAITVIRGIMMNAHGPGKHMFWGRSLVYVEYASPDMLTRGFPPQSDRGALTLDKKRHWDRFVEVYRSNKDSIPCWDRDCRDGIHGWRTIIRTFRPDEQGVQRREWRATWINPRRIKMLEMYGYEEYSRGPSRGMYMDDELEEVTEDEENTWIAQGDTQGAPVVPP